MKVLWICGDKWHPAEVMKRGLTFFGEQVSGYVREMGEGRLVMLAPGHHIDVWENKNFQKLLVNALHWAGRK